MHVIPSSAQAAYDQASSPCKLAAPRIAASLDELPLSVLCDPDRGTLEAVEFCGLLCFMPSAASLRPERSTFLSFVKRSLLDFQTQGSEISRRRRLDSARRFNRSACNEGER